MFNFLNIFFFVFHTVFMLFNIFAWMFKKTRKLHLITLLLTTFSWFILGIWFGFGYCFCTHWHWMVRARLVLSTESLSYIHFLILKLTGINFNERLVTIITIIIFFICFLMSILLNIRDYCLNNKKRKLNNRQ